MARQVQKFTNLGPHGTIPIAVHGRRFRGRRFKRVDHYYEINGVAVHIWRAAAGQYGIQVRGKRDSALTFNRAKQRAVRMVRLGT